VAEVGQGIQTFVAYEYDAATATAVAAVRTAKGDIFLATKTHTAIAAVTGDNIDVGFVNEFHGDALFGWFRKRFAGPKIKKPHFVAKVGSNAWYRSGLGGDDVYDLATPGTFLAEFDNTIRFGKQGVVLATAHIDAGVKLGAALANEDIARQHLLTGITLHAKAL
jgi:hypothetical protein